MSISDDLFKELMRRFAAGVTLVTFNENGKFIKLLKPLNMTKKNLVIFTTRVVCHQAVFYNKKIRACRLHLNFHTTY